MGVRQRLPVQKALRPRLHYRLLTLCPAPTDPVPRGQPWGQLWGQLWPIGSSSKPAAYCPRSSGSDTQECRLDQAGKIGRSLCRQDWPQDCAGLAAPPTSLQHGGTSVPAQTAATTPYRSPSSLCWSAFREMDAVLLRTRTLPQQASEPGKSASVPETQRARDTALRLDTCATASTASTASTACLHKRTQPTHSQISLGRHGGAACCLGRGATGRHVAGGGLGLSDRRLGGRPSWGGCRLRLSRLRLCLGERGRRRWEHARRPQNLQRRLRSRFPCSPARHPPQPE